jgi:hypothetical protein
LLFFKKHIAPYFELSVWIAGLLFLAAINPASESHYTLCVFKWAGFSFCPGCGLGHSVSWLFHGDIQQSFKAHPLGTVALVVLLFRIFTLIKMHFNLFNNQKQYNGNNR